MVRHAVGDRAHAVLADAVVEVPALARLAVEGAGAFDRVHRRLGEIGVAADQPRHRLRDRAERVAGRVAGGHLVARLPGRKGRVPGLRQLVRPRQAPLLGQVLVLGGPAVVRLAPCRVRLAAARGRVHVRADLGGDVEGVVLVRPAERGLGADDFLLAERRAVGLGRVRLVRRAVADRRVDDDQGGPGGVCARGLDRVVDPLEVGVPLRDVQDLPSVGLVARRRVLVGRLGERPVERDAVRVVEDDEAAEPQEPGDRAGLLRHAFHQVAVGGDHVRPVVDDAAAGPVVAVGEPALGDGHPDRVRDPLPQGPGRRFDTGRDRRLGMPRRLRLPLAEVLELRHRQVVAGQVEERVEERRAVPARKHEAVAVGPLRVARVVLQVALPEDVRHRRGVQREPRMAGVRGLRLVDRQRADRGDAELVDLGEGRGVDHGRLVYSARPRASMRPARGGSASARRHSPTASSQIQAR